MTMNSTQSMKQLLVTIQEDRKRYISLNKLLIEQHHFIIECNANKLLEINQRLTNIYQALSQTAMERLTLLKQLKVVPCRDEIHSLFPVCQKNIVSMSLPYGLI